MMSTDYLLERLNILCDEADRLYPSWSNAPAYLRELKEKLQIAHSKQEQLAVLIAMEGYMRGGQGSFGDIFLDPPVGSQQTKTEVNAEFDKITNLVYSEVRRLIAQLT